MTIGTRNPTMTEAIHIISMQLSRNEQNRQLRFMADTQGQEFARQVHDRVKEAGGLKKP
jgi:hypothetical protein